MNDTTRWETLIQRLVDSDLSSDEKNELLKEGDQQQLWKPIALAFLEKQALDHSLGALKASHASPMDFLGVNPDPTETVENGVSAWWRYGCIVATAAALLLMLYSGPPSVSNPSVTSAIAQNKESVNADVLELTEALERSGAPIPEGFRLDLLHAGYLLSESKQVADVNLPFGGTIQMPVRRFDLRYLGQSAFQ